MKQTLLANQFVKFIPDKLSEGVIYISLQYGTAAHKCCCGCGEEVITPLTPTDWTLHMNNNAVTLDPSIGNWSFACRSHYWIHNNKVVWAGEMSQQRIERGREMDRAAKHAYFKAKNHKVDIHSQLPNNTIPPKTKTSGLLNNLWQTIKQFLNL